MGIPLPLSIHIAKNCANYGAKGRCLVLGSQAIGMTMANLAWLMCEIGTAKNNDGNIEVDPVIAERFNRLHERDAVLSNFLELREQGFISDLALFTAIGFDEVWVLDASSYEGADFVFDMNQRGIMDVLKPPFDWVVDIGTTEHIFNVMNVFQNIHEALGSDGHVLHFVPGNSGMNHGFFQFSPILYYQYYHENGYDLKDLKLFESDIDQQPDSSYEVRDYQPPNQRLTGENAHSDEKGRQTEVFVCAQKGPDSTGGIVPQQFFYKARWDEGAQEKLLVPRKPPV